MTFVTKSTWLISILEERVCASMAEKTRNVHASTWIAQFVIGGSHALLSVMDTYPELEGIEDDGDM